MQCYPIPKSKISHTLTRTASRDDAQSVILEKPKVSALAHAKMCVQCIGPEAGGHS